MKTTGMSTATRFAALAITMAAALALPTLASARMHHYADAPARLVGRETGNNAPEIDPGTLRSMAALIAGGLAILGARRRSRP